LQYPLLVCSGIYKFPHAKNRNQQAKKAALTGGFFFDEFAAITWQPWQP
jgi:hypothetical protein